MLGCQVTFQPSPASWSEFGKCWQHCSVSGIRERKQKIPPVTPVQQFQKLRGSEIASIPSAPPGGQYTFPLKMGNGMNRVSLPIKFYQIFPDSSRNSPSSVTLYLRKKNANKYMMNVCEFLLFHVRAKDDFGVAIVIYCQKHPIVCLVSV